MEDGGPVQVYAAVTMSVAGTMIALCRSLDARQQRKRVGRVPVGALVADAIDIELQAGLGGDVH